MLADAALHAPSLAAAVSVYSDRRIPTSGRQPPWSAAIDPVFDILKALIGPVTAVGLAWLVGNKLSADWTHRQKRREHGLAASAEFYRMYGEFFAVWKRANYAFRDSRSEPDEATLRDLVRQATSVEATGEAILLRIASEVQLSEEEVKTLGLFRQGAQRLRTSIVKRKILGWVSSEHPEYQAFKRLSVGVGQLVARIGSDRRSPTAEQAQTQLRDITHNKWSKEWDRRFAADAARSIVDVED